jgi:hypothetical protein
MGGALDVALDADVGPADLMAESPDRNVSPADADAPVPDARDLPLETTVDARADLVDQSSDGPPVIEGVLQCLPEPERADLIADFEDGTATTVAVNGRGGTTFHLVTTGAGQIGVSPPRPFPLCGSSRFMTLQGAGLPPNRFGHIQAHFLPTSPVGDSGFFDGRAFRGIRLSARASRSLSLSLRVPDRNTVRAALPYDHFSATLTVTPGWRTYLVPFESLRQTGVGVAFPALDPQQLFAIELSAMDARDFDISIDGVTFTH